MNSHKNYKELGLLQDFLEKTIKLPLIVIKIKLRSPLVISLHFLLKVKVTFNRLSFVYPDR